MQLFTFKNTTYSDLPGKFKVDKKTQESRGKIQQDKQTGTSAAYQTNHYFPFSLKCSNLKKIIVATIYP